MTDDSKEYGDNRFEKWMFRHEVGIMWLMGVFLGLFIGLYVGSSI